MEKSKTQNPSLAALYFQSILASNSLLLARNVQFSLSLPIQGKIINQEDLAEIALHSNILDVEEDYLEADFREKCENLLPNPVDVLPIDCAKTYCLLKEILWLSTST